MSRQCHYAVHHEDEPERGRSDNTVDDVMNVGSRFPHDDGPYVVTKKEPPGELNVDAVLWVKRYEPAA